MAPRWSSCALCVLAVGCGSDVIQHADVPTSDPDEGASVGVEPFAEVGTVSTMSGSGNYPEPALTRCGELGDGTYPIEGLRSAWGVVAVGGTEDADGEVEPGTIRLRLVDEALADCQDALEVGGWGFAVTLTPSEAAIGVNDLASLFAPDIQLLRGGEASTMPITGTLELVRVTQDCVVGVLDEVTVDGVAVPEMSGGFAAELCARSCLPTATHGC